MEELFGDIDRLCWSGAWRQHHRIGRRVGSSVASQRTRLLSFSANPNTQTFERLSCYLCRIPIAQMDGSDGVAVGWKSEARSSSQTLALARWPQLLGWSCSSELRRSPILLSPRTFPWASFTGSHLWALELYRTIANIVSHSLYQPGCRECRGSVQPWLQSHCLQVAELSVF